MTEKNTNYKKLTEREEWLAAEMIEISFSIHRTLGPGLLESIYEQCFCHELAKRGISFLKQHPVQLRYKDLIIDNGLRIDLLVEDCLIIELKAQENFHPV